MKSLIFYLSLTLLSLSANAQTISARIDTIEGIIVNRYMKHKIGFYCETPTLLLKKGDSIVFFQKSSSNVSLLRKYPSLINTLGDLVEYEYDYLFEFSRGIFKHDLTISNFNFHTEEFGKQIVKSSSFYAKDGDADLYSIYQFVGLVVVYNGNISFSQEFQDDCFCPNIGAIYSSFAVLKEVLSLEKLTDEQVLEMRLVRSGIHGIEVFYCE